LLTLTRVRRHRGTDAGCADRAVRLWDTTTLRCVRTLRGHGAEVSALAASPQQGADLGVSADRGGAVLLWRTAGDAPARAGPALDSAVMCLALSPAHAGLAAAGCASGAVVLLDLTSGTAVKRLAAHAGEVHAAAFARIPGGGVLMATAGRDRAVHLWHIDSTPASAALRRTHHVPKAGPNVSDAQRERLWVALAWLPQQAGAAEQGGTLQLAGSGFGGDVMVWDVSLPTLAVSAPHKLGACGDVHARTRTRLRAVALTAAHTWRSYTQGRRLRRTRGACSPSLQARPTAAALRSPYPWTADWCAAMRAAAWACVLCAPFNALANKV
jgi:hypothetical protein